MRGGKREGEIDAGGAGTVAKAPRASTVSGYERDRKACDERRGGWEIVGIVLDTRPSAGHGERHEGALYADYLLRLSPELRSVGIHTGSARRRRVLHR